MFQFLDLPKDHPVVAYRRQVCAGCPHRVTPIKSLGKLVGSNCTQCGCFLQAKTRVSSQRCPLGYWEAVS
jgi:hypothetical protein